MASFREVDSSVENKHGLRVKHPLELKRPASLMLADKDCDPQSGDKEHGSMSIMPGAFPRQHSIKVRPG
jgi:hypothetical protein